MILIVFVVEEPCSRSVTMLLCLFWDVSGVYVKLYREVKSEHSYVFDVSNNQLLLQACLKILGVSLSWLGDIGHYVDWKFGDRS